MTNKPQFEPLPCEQWELQLAEAVEGRLAASSQALFDEHAAACDACAQLLTNARRGHQWLHMLPPAPEPSANLLHRILSATSGEHSQRTAVGGAAAIPMQPAWHPVTLAGLHKGFEPRLWMTAAMAFFSIALTLNLSGVSISQLRWSDLRPSALRSNIERQVISAGTPVIRYYDHLRIVYEVESRVREYQRSQEGKQPSQQGKPGSAVEKPKGTLPAQPVKVGERSWS